MEIKSSENIRSLIEDLDEMIERIFLSGLGVVKENIVNDIKVLSEKSTEVGFSFAGEKLMNIYDELNKKYHSMKFDHSKIVKEYYLLNGYVDIIKESISENLM